MHFSGRLLLDACMGMVLLYGSIWTYELGNFIVLSALGVQASLAFAGALPIGVTAVVPDSRLLLFAKPLQVIISAAVMLGLFFLARSHRLPISATITLTMVSICLASSYWEVLSLVGSRSYEVHFAIFSALGMAAQLGLSRLLKA